MKQRKEKLQRNQKHRTKENILITIYNYIANKNTCDDLVGLINES